MRGQETERVWKRLRWRDYFAGEGAEAFISLILCRRSRSSLRFDSEKPEKEGERERDRDRAGKGEKLYAERKNCARKMALTVNPIGFREN